MVTRMAFALAFVMCCVSVSFSADVEPRIKALEETLKKQETMIREQNRIINELREELSGLRLPRPDKQVLERAGQKKAEEPAELEQRSPASADTDVAVSGGFGDFFKDLRNPAITFVLNSFYYSSSVNERNLRSRGITGFSRIMTLNSVPTALRPKGR